MPLLQCNSLHANWEESVCPSWEGRCVDEKREGCVIRLVYMRQVEGLRFLRKGGISPDFGRTGHMKWFSAVFCVREDTPLRLRARQHRGTE